MALDLTIEECMATVTWALAKAAEIPFRRGAWNAEEFLFKEHCLGLANAGGTVYKCAVGFNIDFDLRCDCCGAILAIGSVDIDGPVHDGGDDVSQGVVLARSAGELAAALGGNAPSRRLPDAAASYIFETLQRGTACSCPD